MSALYAAELLRWGKLERKSQCMALEEYWERGRGTGDAGLPLVVLVRIAVEGCGDASLIRKRSSDNLCDWRGEWPKGSGRLVMSAVGSQERSAK